MIETIKNPCIEVAVQMSNTGSRQARNCVKGNHRRVFRSGMNGAWGCREYLQHSYLGRGAITFDEIRM